MKNLAKYANELSEKFSIEEMIATVCSLDENQIANIWHTGKI